MSKSASTSTSSSAIGCASLPLSVLLFGACMAAWVWSHGADPRTAVADGLIFGLQVTGGICVASALFVGVLLSLVVWAKTR